MSVSVRKLEPLRPLSFGQEVDPTLVFASHGFEAVRAAQDAAEKNPFTYRVSVGAAALFLANDGDMTVVSAANVKLWRGGNRKGGVRTCAEAFVHMEAPFTRGKMIGMAVASAVDLEGIKSITEFPTLTLHSCETCRDQFGKLISNDDIEPDMPIVTARLDDVYELHTAEGMIRAYNNGGPNLRRANGIDDPGLANWQNRAMELPHSALSVSDGFGAEAVALYVMTGQAPV